MTGKLRMLTALAGGTPDRVPFVPNIWQWFHVNRARGTLPDELADAATPVAALRRIGADVMSKFDGICLVERLHRCQSRVSFEDDGGPKPQWTSFASFEGGNVRRERIETPDGTLSHAQVMAALEQVVDLEGVHVFEFPENLDSLFYSPPLFREFCLPVMQKAARMVHQRGKHLFASGCKTSPAMPFANLRAFRDAAWKYGRFAAGSRFSPG